VLPSEGLRHTSAALVDASSTVGQEPGCCETVTLAPIDTPISSLTRPSISRLSLGSRTPQGQRPHRIRGGSRP